MDTNKDGKCDTCGTVLVATPSIPQNLIANPTGDKQITVSWDAVEGATQYNVYRYNGTAYKYIGTTFATAAKPTQYIDTGLTVGTDYYYKVVAVYKGDGLTLQSDKSAFAHTVALGTPAIPANVAVTPTAEKELTVSWEAVKGATQYNVYRYRGSDQQYHYIGTTFTSASKPTEYVDAGLSAGTTYYYKVLAACKGNGLTFAGALSVSVCAVALGKPAVPANVTVKPTAEKELTVSWDAVKGATQYNVYRYRASDKAYHYIGTTFATAAKPTEYADTGLTAGVTYYYKVLAACKGSGLTFVGNLSASVNATAQGALAVPQNAAAKASGDKAITVSWDAVDGATQYNVYRYRGSDKAYHYIGTTFATDADPTQYVNKGLTAGTTYYYKVVAVKKTADYTLVSAMSASVSAKAITAPAAPQNVTALAAGAQTVVLYWSESAGATQYNIYRSASATGTFKYIGTSYSSDYVNQNLTAGSTYYYKVVAVNKTADYTLVSEQSAAVSAKAK